MVYSEISVESLAAAVQWWMMVFEDSLDNADCSANFPSGSALKKAMISD